MLKEKPPSSPAPPAASAWASPRRWHARAPTSCSTALAMWKAPRPKWPPGRQGGLPRRRHEQARRDRRHDAFAAEQFGRVDILVNNAGIQHVANVEDFPVERWDAIIAINLSSAFHATRLALPAMKAANWGRIINVASVHGLVASAQKSAYVAAKHGIVGLTKVTALENATTGVTCNAICPGWVLTPLVQKQVDAKAPPMAGPTKKPPSCCWAKKSLPCSSPRPKNWASWRCSSAPRRQQRARRGLEHGRRLGCAVGPISTGPCPTR
jgi:hypothetical protein